MYKPDRILEARPEQTHQQQTLYTSQTQNPSYPSFCSPFRKHLPVIYQTEGSPHLSFDTERADYLKSQYESRLIAVDEELFGSRVEGSLPNDSQLLNQREKQLLNKIYDKQKQLVMLQNKFHLLKNSNQCLRDTIKEDQLEKQQLNQELFKFNQQSAVLKEEYSEMKQKTTELSQKITTLQQELNKAKLNESEEQAFFRDYDMQSQSIHELQNQNKLLRKQIQQLKAFYEEQFYRMIENNQQTVKYLEQRIKNITEDNSQLESQTEDLSEKLLLLNNQKKQMLSYYLQIIEHLKKEISSSKNPATHSQSFIQQQDSFLQPKTQRDDPVNATLIHQHLDLSVYDHKYNHSFDIAKILGKALRNRQDQDKSRSRSKHHNKSRPKSIHNSGSVSSLNLNMNINMQSNPRLNTTLMSYKRTDRILPTKRFNKPSPIKKSFSPMVRQPMLSLKMPISSFLSKQLETPRLRANPCAKKYQEIDKKLQILKDKLIREITY